MDYLSSGNKTQSHKHDGRTDHKTGSAHQLELYLIGLFFLRNVVSLWVTVRLVNIR